MTISSWIHKLIAGLRPPAAAAPPAGAADLGAWGEQRACDEARRRGLTIVARNLHLAGGELDIVGHNAEGWVFIEVKARRSAARGRPAEAVHRAKRARIVRAARAFLARRQEPARRCRFDVVEILAHPAPGEPALRWTEDAFWAVPEGER